MATPAQKAKAEQVFHEWGQGRLHDGPDKYGHIVAHNKPSQKQAIAIALHESGQSRSNNPHIRAAQAGGPHHHGNPHA